MDKIRLCVMVIVGMLVMSAVITSCSKEDSSEPTPPPVVPDTPDTPDEDAAVQDNYSQAYRPQIHFSPAQNWINDPNGMVYDNGVWHLFYQYNPYGNDWGNMSWGHATSSDLVHWSEQAVALTKSSIGDIFSGSCVIDKDNTAGFGKDAMIAVYTGNGNRQQQGIAYSVDGGKTFTQYASNPVIANTTMADFRDPKVFWHDNSSQWIMVLARGNSHAVDIYGSADLKKWTFLSSFTSAVERTRKGQWECPDLFPLSFGGKEKWVMLVSVNPGGPTNGSGTMYFVGDFDGTTFSADPLDYPLWIDCGMDNYAGVTWSNAGDRRILIGWMNNWLYAGSVPCSPWRSAMTLPRELSLVDIGGKPVLASRVVSEVDALASSWEDAVADRAFADGKAYHLQVTLGTETDQSTVLSNAKGEKLVIDLNSATRKLTVHRNAATGDISFVGNFSYPAVHAPLVGDRKELSLDIYVDQSSVEIFSDDGTVVMTNLVFPSSIYNMCATSGSAKVRTLKSIWQK